MGSRVELKAASFGLLGGLLAISAWRYYDNHLRWRMVARRRRRCMDEGSPELPKMTSGSGYVSSDKGLQAMLQAAHTLCEEYNSRGRGAGQRQEILSRLLGSFEIRIGNNCFLGPGVKIYTAAHPLNAVRRRSVEFALPIEIGDDVWIGGDAIICPGVKVGSRVVIAAGAVVTKDVPNDVLVAGVPATIKKSISLTPLE